MPTYCGVSVDTRTAPGDDDPGRWDTLRRSERPRALKRKHVRTGGGVVAPLSVVWASITVSQRHPGIHRHPTVCRHGSTPQMAHDESLIRTRETVPFVANPPFRQHRHLSAHFSLDPYHTRLALASYRKSPTRPREFQAYLGP